MPSRGGDNGDSLAIRLLLEELKETRQDIRDIHAKIDASNVATKESIEKLEAKFTSGLIDVDKAVTTLKTRFMMVAVTMGLAGGKASTFLPFLK